MAIVVDVHEVWCHRIPNEHIIVPYLQPTDVEWVINYCRFVFVGTKIFSYTFGAILSVNVVFEPYKKRYIGSFENLYFQPFFYFPHIKFSGKVYLWLSDEPYLRAGWHHSCMFTISVHKFISKKYYDVWQFLPNRAINKNGWPLPAVRNNCAAYSPIMFNFFSIWPIFVQLRIAGAILPMMY